MPRDTSSTRSTLTALALVLAMVGGVAILPRLVRGHGATPIGRDAPDFTLALVANGASLGKSARTLTLSDLRGRPVLLDFWATWCQPCRMQAPIIDRFARRWRDRGVVAVGVSTDMPGQGDPHGFAVARGLSYPIVDDGEGAAARTYGVDELPTLVVVSPAGKIVAVRTGVTEEAELERLIGEAL